MTPDPYLLVIGMPDSIFVRTVNAAYELCYEPMGGVGVLPDGQLVQPMIFSRARWVALGSPDITSGLKDLGDLVK